MSELMLYGPTYLQLMISQCVVGGLLSDGKYLDQPIILGGHLLKIGTQKLDAPLQLLDMNGLGLDLAFQLT
jgi:hypothetical protein